MNLNQVSFIINDFFDSHLQVNTIMNGNAKDFIAKRDKEYFAVNYEFINSGINGKIMNFNFSITIGDLLNEAHDNENNIFSDCLTIAEDFYTYMADVNGVIFNKSSNIQKFEDGDGDRISGITFNIQLGVIRSQNICVLPLESDEVPPINANRAFTYQFPYNLD
ncbi:hypothetical protein [Pedobacter gandavensis]|uniref:hypothetical protein n=1 Tax=Pedobacter gandavensis TaxID=2679963 RepID=UPI00292D5277|nr:hypothetical protein [Pedobacter gandavensis]